MEVRHNVVSVMQRDINRHDGKHQTRETTQREHAQKADTKQHRRLKSK